MGKYLYNNVELPEFPEYDGDLYPISVITEHEKYDGTKYYILMVSNTMTRDGNVIKLGEGLLWRCQGNDFTSWEVFTSLIPDTAFNLYEETTDILWANTTLQKSDGSLWIAASVPIPANGYSSYVHSDTWQKGTFYKRLHGAWVKHQAYKRQNGAWVKVKE